MIPNLNNMIFEANILFLLPVSVFQVQNTNEVSCPATYQAIEDLKNYSCNGRTPRACNYDLMKTCNLSEFLNTDANANIPPFNHRIKGILAASFSASA